MMERRLKKSFALLLTVCLAISIVAFAEDDAAEMAAYWQIVGNTTHADPLTRAMNGAHETLTLAELKAVTPEELLSFAAVNRLPVSMARYAYYSALAACLSEELTTLQPDTAELLSLFLRMRENHRNTEENAQRRTIRKAMTEADINAYAAQTGLPAGFLAWLLLDDEWYETDWEEGDDWREGRGAWDFADWVDAYDLREKYGKDAVVTDDDVERILRQNGHRFDD